VICSQRRAQPACTPCVSLYCVRRSAQKYLCPTFSVRQKTGRTAAVLSGLDPSQGKILSRRCNGCECAATLSGTLGNNPPRPPLAVPLRADSLPIDHHPIATLTGIRQQCSVFFSSASAGDTRACHISTVDSTLLSKVPVIVVTQMCGMKRILLPRRAPPMRAPCLFCHWRAYLSGFYVLRRGLLNAELG